MVSTDFPWYKLTKKERKIEIINRRINGDSFAKIAKELLGSEKKKSTIWSWAKRNLEEREMYPAMRELPQEPYKKFSEVEQWIIFDYISSLYPRLDAMSAHLVEEIRNILVEQQKGFHLTAGFLDELEQRVIEAIRRNTATLTTRVAMATSSTPPPPPRAVSRGVTGAPPPPPPPSTAVLPSQTVVAPGTISELRTDFEEMSMEEISLLPPDFLEALSPTDRGRLQARVKELRMIEKMSPEEREEYLAKKKQEKEREEAAEGLGASLSSMLEDNDSLFARMRRAADDSQVSGTGTFGKFTIEYTYFYCFSCGKMNRSEDGSISGCEYCGASPEFLVLDDEKSNYTYWECLSEKAKEPVDLDYTRGKQIAIRSRWKTPVNEVNDLHGCDKDSIREITSSVEIKADPDKQFSHYLTLFRLYTQLPMQGDLKTYFDDLRIEIQKVPDILSKEDGIIQAGVIMEKIQFLIDWISSQDFMEENSLKGEVEKHFENLKKDIGLLFDSDSPQELKKA
ncbi:MAG: hypothetical protein ACTSR2_08555, partial [Candidatus Hodarchaeales archaeon]